MRSKRPFGTKLFQSPLERIFFTDRDLGKAVPRILRENGLAVERYCDYFQEKNVADPEWLTFAARKGWVALTHDNNIKRDPVAIRTIMKESGHLFIVRGVLTGAATARLVLDAIESVDNVLRLHDEAFIAVVRREILAGGVSRPSVHVRLTATKWADQKDLLMDHPDDEEEDDLLL